MMKRSLVFLLAVGFAAIWAGQSAQAASFRVEVGATELLPGESTGVDLFLDLGAEEQASLFQGVFAAVGSGGASGVLSGSGTDGVIDTRLAVLGGDIGNTWPNAAANRVDGNSGVSLSLTSDNTGGERLVLSLTLTASGAGTIDLVVSETGALVQRDLSTPPFIEDVSVSNLGSSLATINVVPEPGTVLLLGLGLGSLALYGRRRTREE